MKPLYLVGIDGSECSQRATERAITLAEYSGARVTLVYVLDQSSVQQIISEGIVVPSVDPEAEERFVQKKITKPLIEKYNQLGVELNCELIRGDPVEVLLAQVKKQGASMIFAGRRGRSSLTDLLVGSVANKLAHSAEVPVVLVP